MYVKVGYFKVSTMVMFVNILFCMHQLERVKTTSMENVNTKYLV